MAAYALCLAVLAVGLAACSDTPTEPEPPSPDPTPNEITVVVEGNVLDESDQEPIEDAAVAVYDDDTQLASTTTDEEGVFEMSFTVDESDAPSEVRLEAEADGYLLFETTLDVAETISYDVEMEFDGTRAAASGTIRAEATGDRLEGATVIGTDAATDDELFEATTDEWGEYAVDFVAGDEPAEVTVTAEAEGYQAADTTVSFSAELNVDLELKESSYAGGQGTEADPYQIETATHLQNMRENLDAHYVLIADIDAGETAQWNDEAGFEPIGHINQEPFTGSLDSDGYHITGLVINRPDEDAVGLFAFTIEARLTGITVSDVSINGANYTGGIVGRAHGESEIHGAHVSGEVTGQHWVGGLAGQLSAAEIHDSSAEAAVEATQGDVGGLVGDLVESQIHGSHALGAVDTGSSNAGGLVGRADESSIHDSYAEGDVNGRSSTGGLIGVARNESDIRRSYAEGDVEGSGDSIGGLIGLLLNSTVHASYARGAVSGDEEVGGLVGLSFDQGEVVQSYATGSVNGADGETGGLIGTNSGTASDSYWDTESSGHSNGVAWGSISGIEGLTTIEMLGNNAETNMSGFDFSDTWVTVPFGYPILHWQE